MVLFGNSVASMADQINMATSLSQSQSTDNTTVTIQDVQTGKTCYATCYGVLYAYETKNNITYWNENVCRLGKGRRVIKLHSK